MDTFEKVKEIVMSFDFSEGREITPESHFSEMGLDSIDLMEVIMEIEESFSVEISDEELSKMRTVGDLCEFLE